MNGVHGTNLTKRAGLVYLARLRRRFSWCKCEVYSTIPPWYQRRDQMLYNNRTYSFNPFLSYWSYRSSQSAIIVISCSSIHILMLKISSTFYSNKDITDIIKNAIIMTNRNFQMWHKLTNSRVHLQSSNH